MNRFKNFDTNSFGNDGDNSLETYRDELPSDEKELIEEFDGVKEVEEKLFEICLRDLKNISMEQEIYCLNICYGSEELIPPLFAFGESKDREEWLKSNPSDIESYLWNIAEYSYEDKEFKIENEKTKELFHRYNELASELELWNVQVRTILTVAKKLKKNLSEFNWNMSDDFVIAVTDLEQVDVQNNFEFLNE